MKWQKMQGGGTSWWYLVNNHRILEAKHEDKMTQEDWDKTKKVNLNIQGTIGTALATQELLHNQYDSIDYGSWNSPVKVYGVCKINADALKELLEEEGFKVTIV